MSTPPPYVYQVGECPIGYGWHHPPHYRQPECTPVRPASKPDWSDRHASTQHIMKFFAYVHLPAGAMRNTSRECAQFAEQIANTLPDGPELSAGMRKLLEAKDCFVRAALEIAEKAP